MEGEQTLKIVLTVKVLEIMPPITYTSKKGVSQMLTGIVADTEAFADIHVYDVAKFPLFRVDEAVKISDFIKKADGSLVITQISNVSTTKARIVDIPLEVKEAASKKSDCVSVLTASTSPLRSTVSVKGKVVFAGKSTTKRLRLSGEEVAFKRLKVKDSTGVVNIALWRDFAESPIEKGSFVTLHNFQTTQTYDINTKSQKPVLSNRSSKSAVEFIPSFDDISDDSNDSEMEEDSSLVGEILGIKSLNTYRCCLIDKCCKKKVTMEFRCPTCGIQYTAQSAGHAAILKLLIKGSEMTLFTAFTECINQLLSSMNIAMDLSNKEKTLKSLMAALPIKVSYSFTGTNVTKLKKL